MTTNSAVAAPMPFGTMPLIGNLPMRQAVFLMITVAAAIALGIGAWLWAKEPDYRVLFSNLNDRDGGAIIAALAPMNVPYKFAEGGGAILVPAGQVHEMRLRLASQGLPKGSVVGMELVDNQKFGATQFQEQINFQRGLEGELARSIQALTAVQAARVHLAIPKPSVFLREQQLPSASVLLTLHQGRQLDRGQINGIAHLIASSVPELTLERVSIVDQSGGLLSQRRDGADGSLDSTQLAYIRQIEQATIQRISDILEPVVGRNNVRVQVTADVDFTRSESMAESFKPNQDMKTAALRTQQTTESMTSAATGAGGVPGAMSNQPPAAGVAVIDGKSSTTAGTAGSAPTSSRKDASVAYEVDKKIEHTRTSTGGVRRMTAAVVINHRRQTDSAGKSTFVAFEAPAMEQITALAREAMGFSKERGDSLNVANAPFNEPEREAVVEVPFWKAPDNIALAKETGRYVLFAGVILYLFFGVVRPMLRQAALRAAAVPSAPEVSAAGPMAALEAPSSPLLNDSLQRARQLARDDPKVVANIVKGWVNPDE
ncbi:MAG: flagellar basal-body MS-ring/collar protein FliF [Betaproteobacteria bacterium]